MIGQAIAHYQITAKLGEGGMGEVYRAMDTKLDREVALKILPAAFASDFGRMARFEREAKLLASLNHPNIAQVYGVEEHALVMELVEGESPKGPLPFEDAWNIASQIASALEYAHERGIIHRDLKPANVKVTPYGVVKLLDFGLAKALTEQKEPSANAEQSPTLTIGATEVGVILGTAAYMAPEQAKGKSVDKRADIWAFGVVLYELLTGERLFKGEDVADTLAQVLTKEPAFDRVPVKARRLLGRCLQKDPKQRLRDISIAGDLLENGAEASAQAKAHARAARLAWVVAVAGIVTALVMGFLYTRNSTRNTPPPGHVQRFTITVPEHTTNLHSLAISPDGRLLAIAAEVNGKRQLWLRAMDSFQIQPMTGTEDAVYPFWSPDSRNIGFFAHGKLQRIASVGGPVQVLCNALTGFGGSWNRDNIIVFSPRGGIGLQRVSAAGGVPTEVTRPKGLFGFPVFLPDGRRFLYVVFAEEERGVYLGSLDGEANRRVLADVSSVFFAAGRLLFTRENALLSQPFDAASGQTRGEISSIAEGIGSRYGYTPATVSQTGVLAYESDVNINDHQMAWYDRGGKSLGTVGARGVILDPAISPDEKSVLFRRSSPSGSDLWLRDLTRQSEQRFTTDTSFNNMAPFWSPKGDRVVFGSIRGGPVNLYQKVTNGTGKDELLFENGDNKEPTQWSRDGRFIVYQENDPKTGRDIWVLPMDGVTDRKPVPFLRSKFDEFQGQLSPDSHWMAYTSDESGQPEVYVQPFPEGESRTKISTAGGEQPRWRGDGKELFFVNAEGKMMTVSMKVTAGTTPFIEPGTPQALFEARLVRPQYIPLFEYDVTADGKRFLLDTTGGDSAPPPVLNIVVNWDAELKK
jgi:Tol biopolymer transport system component